jgi:hypothetical protein
MAADRRDLGDHRIAMHQGRDLAHGVDREISRLLVLALLEIEPLHLVGPADLLEHPAHDRAARLRRMIQSQPCRIPGHRSTSPFAAMTTK